MRLCVMVTKDQFNVEGFEQHTRLSISFEFHKDTTYLFVSCLRGADQSRYVSARSHTHKVSPCVYTLKRTQRAASTELNTYHCRATQDRAEPEAPINTPLKV